MIVAQVSNFTFIVTQTPHKAVAADKGADEKKEGGEGEAKKD